MWLVRIAAPALLLVGTSLAAPAQAFWPLNALTGILSLPFGGAHYYGRYHRRHHYRHARHAPSELARRTPEPAAVGAETARPGRWEFSAELAPSSSGAASPGTNSLTTTRIMCISATNVVPVELGPQCRLDKLRHDGPSMTWSMSCSNARDTVRSNGVAQYHGDTMEASMVSHVPAGNGAVSDISQRITGRYLGPCPRPTQMTAARAAAMPESSGSSPGRSPPGQPDNRAPAPSAAVPGHGAPAAEPRQEDSHNGGR